MSMNFFRKSYKVRRYSAPKNVDGYVGYDFEDITLQMDIQTMSDDVITTPDGQESVKRIKAFCDKPVLVRDPDKQQRADRVFFDGLWFECKSSRLSDNTPLRHYTATFTEIRLPKGGEEAESETG